MIPALANHLLQSTIFAIVAGLLTLALRKNHARTRYWIWLAASMKFLVPLSLFVEIGRRMSWQSAFTMTPPGVVLVMDRIRQPFAGPVFRDDTPATRANALPIVPMLLFAVWFFGCAAFLIYWLMRWKRAAAILRAATPVRTGREIEGLRRLERLAGIRGYVGLASAGTQTEPGVFGIVKPVLLLPSGITERLNDAQLDAVFAHELCHVRYRDNLTAAIHMAVEAIFWFHPLVWWMGTRLVEERERACDEEVVRLGSAPEIYAETILKICRFYLASPMVCAAGISGADLKKRIEDIMGNSLMRRLSAGKKVLLGVTGLFALIAPVTIGILSAPARQAQAQTPVATLPSVEDATPRRTMAQVLSAPQNRPARNASEKPANSPRLKFEVASIKPVNITMIEAVQSGRIGWHIDDTLIDLQSVSVLDLLMQAYQVPMNQITNVQDWMQSSIFDVRATLPAGGSKGQVPAMLQSLLADRFKLAIHHHPEIRPVYELTASSQLNLTPSKPDAPPEDPKVGNCKPENGHRVCRNMTMTELAALLSQLGQMGQIMQASSNDADWTIDRPVVDMTQISGAFDFTLDYGRVAIGGRGRGNSDGPMPPLRNVRDSLDSLGFKLKSAKRPFDVIAIDHVERLPTEN